MMQGKKATSPFLQVGASDFSGRMPSAPAGPPAMGPQTPAGGITPASQDVGSVQQKLDDLARIIFGKQKAAK